MKNLSKLSKFCIADIMKKAKNLSLKNIYIQNDAKIQILLNRFAIIFYFLSPLQNYRFLLLL